MGDVFCPWEAATYGIFSSNVPSLLYYSLIPSMLTALLLGAFILVKTNKSLVSLLLLLLSALFSIWGIFALILWATNSPLTVMLLWSLTILVEPLIYATALYLTLVFVGNNDINYRNKLIIFLLLIPLFIFIPTKYNLEGVVVADCDATEGPVALYLSYFLEILFSLWIVIFSVRSYFKTKDKNKKIKILLFALGIVFFLLSFSSGNIIGSITSDWVISIYGYFGLPVFLSFLSYLILKYQAFDVKVIAAQFFTVAVWIGVFSQFFIMQERSNQILTGITLALITVFGWMLFRSIKEEVKVSHELGIVSRKLAGINARLEELDRAKSEFISIASHQLRTPLTSVKGFTSLILDKTFGKIAETQQRAVEKIFVNNEKLVLLVEDMLNASRLEAGRLEYEFEQTDVVSVVSATIETLKLYAKSKKIKLVFKKPKGQMLALIDQRKVSEILANLIDNAVKYTPKGTVTVSMAKFKMSEKIGEFKNTTSIRGNWVRISVKDTGVGMSKHQLETIFEKFKGGDAKQEEEQKSEPTFQEHANGNGISSGGTGLGVYISRQMAIAMKGCLYATSAGKNKGSTFILELPLVKK